MAVNPSPASTKKEVNLLSMRILIYLIYKISTRKFINTFSFFIKRKMVKVAINGFGRIGKIVFRVAMEKGVNVVAINDMNDAKAAAYTLKYDSVHGKFKGDVRAEGKYLVVNGKKILVVQEKDPTKLPWKQLGVDFVVESTGIFRHREDAMKHITAGAKKVIVSAPMKDKADITLVPGVNNHM